MKHKIKILILDDNKADIELMQFQLRKCEINYEIALARDEESYEKALRTFVPDIILSDYTLPSFDGLEAFRIRQKIAPQIPFIIVSGNASENNCVELMENGVTEFVWKDKLFILPVKIMLALKKWEKKKEKEEAEEKLKNSEARLKQAQAIAHLGSWELNFESNKAKWSEEACLIYGLSPEENVQTFESWLAFIHPDDLERIKKEVKESWAALTDTIFTHRILLKSGEVKHIHSVSKFEFDTAGKPTGLYGIAFDITARKKAEEKLIQSEMQIRNFARHLSKVQEEERSRIAREIHDELGQQLAGFKLGLASLKSLGNQENNLTEKVNDMLKDVDAGIQSLSKIATELRPGILDTLGLIASIEWLISSFEKKTKIKCRLELNVHEQTFDKHLSICFFRICQEALTNISKHAQATEVVIHIDQNETGLSLRITDNGQGFDKSKLKNPFSLGITGMRERAGMIGGELYINSVKDHGTSILLEVSLDETTTV